MVQALEMHAVKIGRNSTTLRIKLKVSETNRDEKDKALQYTDIK